MPYEIISFLSLLGVAYLLFCRIKDQNQLKSKSKEAESGGIYLPPIKKMPEPHSVDPDLRLLKDVMKTCKLESWKPTIKIDYSVGSYYLYEINIDNPTGTLKIKARVRHGTDQDMLRSPTRVVGFFIIDTVNGSLSYQDHEVANILCLEFLWNNYIIPHHQSEHDVSLSHYLSIKESIDSRLVSLRRNKSLEDILNQE